MFSSGGKEPTRSVFNAVQFHDAGTYELGQPVLDRCWLEPIYAKWKALRQHNTRISVESSDVVGYHGHPPEQPLRTI